MALSLGKSFNRHLKLRLPFQDYFYDIGVFYSTYINFNLFDIKTVLKYNRNVVPSNVKINMYKNIEASIFCTNCLDLTIENNRLSYYEGIHKNWKDKIKCINTEYIDMGIDNYIRINIFNMCEFEKNFLFLLVERKNKTKIHGKQLATTLSGIQISTSEPIDTVKKESDNSVIMTPEHILMEVI